jgi:cytochrome c oxidase subunit 1
MKAERFTPAVESVQAGLEVFPGGAAASGWTAYPPLSAVPAYSEVDWGQTLWILAVALEFTSFLMGGINILTTTINMRAPGLSLFAFP